MILVPTAEFGLPASVGSSSSAAITCHRLHFQKRLLFVGLSTGQIVCFRRRVDAQGVEQVEQKPMVLEGHQGTVRSLLIVKQEGLGQDNYLLFSGGADRTVRVWDPAASREGGKQLVQTLRGHGGTVTSLAYGDGVLVSASTDCSIRVWRADEGRELLLYPWFSPHQTLGELECWVNDIALATGEAGALYVGDEHGGLSAYRAEAGAGGARRADVRLTPWRQRPKAHALGIERLLLIVSESLLITCGYDNAVRLWDSGSGAPRLSIEHEQKCRFTALGWDGTNSELILGDAMGVVHFWSVATERCLKREKVGGGGDEGGDRAAGAIRSVSSVSGELLVSTPASCAAWLVVRDVKYTEISGHEGAVISLCVAEQTGAAGASPKVRGNLGAGTFCRGDPRGRGP